jgi:hypothetical protein
MKEKEEATKNDNEYLQTIHGEMEEMEKKPHRIVGSATHHQRVFQEEEEEEEEADDGRGWIKSSPHVGSWIHATRRRRQWRWRR